MKTRIQSILIVIALLFPGFLAQVQGVSPAPDGCYPNFTTAEGCDALSLLTSGAGNTALGWRSLFLDTIGNFNTGVGGGALALNNADSNTAVGAAALLLNTTGTENVAVGTDALVFNDSGTQNTATGAFALFSNTTGGSNTAVGLNALFSNTTNFENTAVGAGALFFSTGDSNTAVGLAALSHNTTGGANIALGSGAGGNVITANNVIAIGSLGANVDNSCYIGQIFGGTVPAGAIVFVDNSGHLGTIVSSQRFKDQIKPMEKASEAIFALKPVAFRYKKEIDPVGTPQFGLVAEDVEKVNPDLVVRDKEGKPYSVRYDQVNAMLLNEFLKEHRAFVEEQRKVDQQQKEIETLKSELKEQRSLIQKVSDKVELRQPATKVATRSP